MRVPKRGPNQNHVATAATLRARRKTEAVRPLKELRRICGGHPELAALNGLLSAEEYLAVTNVEMH